MVSLKTLVFLLVWLFPNLATDDREQPRPAMELEASHWGRFQRGYSWELTKKAEGEADLIIFKGDGKIKRSFSVSRKDIEKLQQSLKDNRFFELPDKIGDEVADGSTRTLHFKLGKQDKTVKIFFVHPGQLSGQKLEDAKRAIMVWVQVRGLFGDKEAFDSRPYDEEMFPKKGKNK